MRYLTQTLARYLSRNTALPMDIWLLIDDRLPPRDGGWIERKGMYCCTFCNFKFIEGFIIHGRPPPSIVLCYRDRQDYGVCGGYLHAKRLRLSLHQHHQTVGHYAIEAYYDYHEDRNVKEFYKDGSFRRGLIDASMEF
jgi:hypothetical protein